MMRRHRDCVRWAGREAVDSQWGMEGTIFRGEGLGASGSVIKSSEESAVGLAWEKMFVGGRSRDGKGRLCYRGGGEKRCRERNSSGEVDDEE